MEHDYLEKFCSSMNLNLIKKLQFNTRKNSYLAVVGIKNSTKKFILKLLGNQSTQTMQSAFVKEVEFYNKNNSNYIPKLYRSGTNFLILEFFNGYTLPVYLDSFFFTKNSDCHPDKLISNLFSMLQWFHDIEFEKGKTSINIQQITANALFDRIGNLISSGPRGSSNLKFESFLLRQIFKLYSNRIQRKFNSIIARWISEEIHILSKYGHNDLHCNNIMVDRDLNVQLIDFENLTSPGLWIVDTLYFSATLFALFSSKKSSQERIKRLAYEYISVREPRLKTDGSTEMTLPPSPTILLYKVE